MVCAELIHVELIRVESDDPTSQPCLSVRVVTPSSEADNALTWCVALALP